MIEIVCSHSTCGTSTIMISHNLITSNNTLEPTRHLHTTKRLGVARLMYKSNQFAWLQKLIVFYIRYILNWVQISQKMLYVWLKSALESEFRETEQCDFRSPDYLNICWPNEDKTILKLDTHTSSNVKKGHFTPRYAWPLVHSLVILLRCSHWVIMISDKIGNCLNFLKKK